MPWQAPVPSDRSLPGGQGLASRLATSGNALRRALMVRLVS